MVKPDKLTVSLPCVVASAQPMLTPSQAPERTSITASNASLPTAVTCWLVEIATNLYQTSSSATPVVALHVMAARLWRAPAVVPATNGVAELSVMALLQLSLAGGA